jgi:hypothetical protein
MFSAPSTRRSEIIDRLFQEGLEGSRKGSDRQESHLDSPRGPCQVIEGHEEQERRDRATYR